MPEIYHWRVEVVSGADTPNHTRGEIVTREHFDAFAPAVAYGVQHADPGAAIRITLLCMTRDTLLRADASNGAVPRMLLDAWGRPTLAVPRWLIDQMLAAGHPDAVANAA